MSAELKYRPDIDGLRGIAILAVVFFHANLGCSGGFVGVDIFFVISGYLITGLIRKDIARNEFQLLEFWSRRIRRILPALSLMVLVCLVAGWFLFLPKDYASLGQSAAAQALLLSNVNFWLQSGYFDQPTYPPPLLHTWSLAVEEQFYLIFPFLLLALKKFPRRSSTWALAILGVFSLGLSIYCSKSLHTSVNFYFLPPRAWELLLGAVVASLTVHNASNRWVREILSWLGFAAILAAIFFYNRHTPFPGITALLPCGWRGSIIWTNSSTLTLIGKGLSMRPLVFVGLISYSLYLWHWPVLVFTGYASYFHPLLWKEHVLLLAASMVMAIASWRFVEVPFRKRMVFQSRVQILSFAGIVTTLLFVSGFSIYKLNGIRSRLTTQALAYQDTPGAEMPNMSLKDVREGRFVELGTSDKHLPPKVLVWGDSHAMAILPLLNVLCREHAVRGLAATDYATAPLLNFELDCPYSLNQDSIPYNDTVMEFIRKSGIRNVILVSQWCRYCDAIDSPITSRFHRSMLETVSALKSAGVRVWILKDVPMSAWDVPRTLTFTLMHHQDPASLEFSSLATYQQDCLVSDTVMRDINPADVTFLDPTRFFIDSRNRLIVEDQGKSLYLDDNHLSIAGAMSLRPLFEPVFEAIEKNNL